MAVRVVGFGADAHPPMRRTNNKRKRIYGFFTGSSSLPTGSGHTRLFFILQEKEKTGKKKG
jgi:hypothetical protein